MSHLTSIVFECFFHVSAWIFVFLHTKSLLVFGCICVCLFMILGKCAMVYKHSTVMWFIVYSKVILFFVLITSQYCEYDQCFFLFFFLFLSFSLSLAHSIYFFAYPLCLSLIFSLYHIYSLYVYLDLNLYTEKIDAVCGSSSKCVDSVDVSKKNTVSQIHKSNAIKYLQYFFIELNFLLWQVACRIQFILL